MKRGLFITFEGPEGSGKSTQTNNTALYLRNRMHRVLCTREPGGTPTGEAIREILQHDKAKEPICAETEALLFAASRAQHVKYVIKPALDNGWIVLCDRYLDSSVAYQGYGRGFSPALIRGISDFAIQGVLPDLTFLLDIDPEMGFERVDKTHRSRDRMELAGQEFHRRVREGYLELVKQEPNRFYVVDASKSVEKVQGVIITALGERLGL